MAGPGTGCADAHARLPGRRGAVGIRGAHRPGQGRRGDAGDEPGARARRRPGRRRGLCARCAVARAAQGQRAQAEPGAGGGRADAGADPRHLRRDRQHLRQALGDAPAARARPVRRLWRPRLRAGSPDARGQPDRQRADAGAGPARRRAAAPGHALARRPGRRGAGARRRAVRPDGGRSRLLCRRGPGRTAPRIARAGHGSGGQGRPCRAHRARGLPGARNAAGQQAARRLPVGAEVVAGTHGCAGRAGAGGLPRRDRAPPRRPGRASRPGGDDARLAAGELAQRRRRAGRRRSARGGRRPAGRLGDELAEDAAGRRLLLDRQRHRRADAIDVRRRTSQRRRQLPARPGRPGHALQLFRQRSHGRRPGGRLDADAAGRVPAHRAPVVGGKRRRWRACRKA